MELELVLLSLKIFLNLSRRHIQSLLQFSLILTGESLFFSTSKLNHHLYLLQEQLEEKKELRFLIWLGTVKMVFRQISSLSRKSSRRKETLDLLKFWLLDHHVLANLSLELSLENITMFLIFMQRNWFQTCLIGIKKKKTITKKQLLTETEEFKKSTKNKNLKRQLLLLQEKRILNKDVRRFLKQLLKLEKNLINRLLTLSRLNLMLLLILVMVLLTLN